MEQEAAHRVRTMSCASRLAAYKATEARGANWQDLSWRQRLEACKAATKLSTKESVTGLRRINSRSSFSGLVDPDALPRLRERHKASFLLLPPTPADNQWTLHSPADDERISDTVARVCLPFPNMPANVHTYASVARTR
jgi:hypothetical protein